MGLIYLFVIASLSLSCVNLSQIAIRQFAPILQESSSEIQKEKSWHFFKTATPGSLQLSELLLSKDPDNRELLALLTKGFASYAFIVNDTEALADRLQSLDSSYRQQSTLNSLSKSLAYGLRYFSLEGISYQTLQSSVREGRLDPLLKQTFDMDRLMDKETIFYTGVSWLLLANYQKTNMLIASQVNLAFALINSVCQIDQGFQRGLCPTLNAVYNLARPKMMGGNPDYGKKLFQSAMVSYPDNHLIPILYIEWFLVPSGQEEEYQKLKSGVINRLRLWREQRFIPGEESQLQGQEMLNLFNAMAEQRLMIIVESESDIF